MCAKRLLLSLLALSVAAAACGGGDGSSAGEVDAGAECSPSDTTLEITAKNLAFDTNCLAAPTGTAFTILFKNEDAGVPHNISILSQGTHNHVFQGENVIGLTKTTYNVPALEAGTYGFHCDVHPNMAGTFVVA